MDTLANTVGKTLIAHGTTAAITRWGVLRVAGWIGLAALAAYFLSTRHKEQASVPLLPAPAPDESARTPDEERRRTPELESTVQYPEGSRTLH